MEKFCSKENNTSIGISWREENTSEPDTLLHPECFLLTESISLILPGCVRIVRAGLCRLLRDAGRGKNRFWIWLKSPSQTSYSRYANGNALEFCPLSLDFQSLETRFWAVSMLDANVCKRGCKRLQPGMQVFASQKTTVYLHRKMPSSAPILMCDEAHGRVFRRAILGSKERRKTSWRGFEGGEKAPNGWISCTKRA